MKYELETRNLELESMNMRRLVLCDFDGTISTKDMGYALPTGFDSKKELSNEKPRRVLRTLQELIQIIENPLLPS